MKYQDLPDWVQRLQSDPRLAEIGFNIFHEDQFKQANPKDRDVGSFGESQETLFLVGCSNFFGRTQYIGLCLDPERPQEIRVALNGAGSPIFFYCDPEIEILRDVYKCYVEKALAIPKEDPLAAIARLRNAEAQTLLASNRKEILFYYGFGDWDDMEQLEEEMLCNTFLSPYAVCQASGPSDGDMSQYLTAFSASLFSLIRLQAMGTTLYFLSFQYEPTGLPYTKQIKAENPDKPLLQFFPDDSPLDLMGVWNETSNCLNSKSAEAVLCDAQKGDKDSALLLSVMTDILGDFEKYFLPLATHSKIEIRDIVAKKACGNGCAAVLSKVLEQGVSKDLQEELRAQYPSLFSKA